MQLAENLLVAGRFRLNRKIGQGGMGSVWHATHIHLDTPCAVKFIEGEFARLPEAQARFEREARAAAQLRSPHVVQILDHGVWETTPYIAMELLDGEDLGKRLQRLGTLPPAEINTIVQQVARALTKAHQAQIVHRDLKPDNIFLVRDDDREIVKVLDFGIAKKNSTTLDSGNNTKTGAMLGTPYYMSPEQAQGTKGVDARSDLWSLAVIVFQALTGKLPFESEALGDLLVKIIMAPIPVPSQVARVPPQFDAWWARAADRDPNRRFATAKDFADSLAMAFGQSAVTDVMERPQLMAQMAAMGSTPNPTNLPPQMMNTPNPGVYPGPPGPMMTPKPAVSGNTTGAPLAKTFDGLPGVPKKSAAVPVLAAVGALVVAGAAVLGVVAMNKKGSKAAASAAIDPTTPSAQTATAATNTPVPPPPATDLVATAAAPATGAPNDPPPPASAAAPPPKPAKPPAVVVATASPPPKPQAAPPPAPAPPPPPPPAKPPAKTPANEVGF